MPDGTFGFTVTKGENCCVIPEDAPIPDGVKEIATWHIHPPGSGNEDFSDNDMHLDQRSSKVNGFIITSSGSLKVDLYMGYTHPFQVYPNLIETICSGCIAH
jgi:hypothetical protein